MWTGRTHPNQPAKQGDVVECRGQNGGVISTTIVTDPKADGRVPGLPGYACRDATPAEVAAARAAGRFKTVTG